MQTEPSYPLHFSLNGTSIDTHIAPERTLLEVLRHDLHAWEVKEGCGKGDCGSCAVLLNGEVRLACLTLGVQADQAAVTTVRGLGNEEHLHPLQQTFLEHGAVQCGFCTPGMLITASAFLDSHPHPTREEIREALAGNLCRCTGYQAIVDAVEAASHLHAGNECEEVTK
ncbi:MAG TPA: (2Fe-2S)-binding protein [Ktedonobacteraceae bacterium]|jgi:aerobic-type carbon monoxide dehydrogenase small subunit (CoxS/CutS family)|nr:(2Fe-2S)-binding protein [Ktedonobacteraceae bacterium]